MEPNNVCIKYRGISLYPDGRWPAGGRYLSHVEKVSVPSTLAAEWRFTALMLAIQGGQPKSHIMSLERHRWKKTQAQSKRRKRVSQTALRSCMMTHQDSARLVRPMAWHCSEPNYRADGRLPRWKNAEWLGSFQNSNRFLNRRTAPGLLLFQASKRGAVLWPWGKSLRSWSVGTRCSFKGKIHQMQNPARVGPRVRSKDGSGCKGR